MGNRNPSPATRFTSENQPANKGRKKGSRDRLSSRFTEMMANIAEKLTEEELLEWAKRDLRGFAKVAASLETKQVEVAQVPEGNLTDDEVDAYLAELGARIEARKQQVN